MIQQFEYELWDGKKVVGHYYTSETIRGNSITFPEKSVLKQEYGVKPKVVEVPYIIKEVIHRGSDIHIKMCLDVRKKSKRQIELIQKGARW